MIPAIKPTARDTYDRGYSLEKDEDNVFANRLGAAASQRQNRRRRWNDIQAQQEKQVANSLYNFENPAFNIITGGTNYFLQELSSKMDRQAHPEQLELFRQAAFSPYQ